MKTAGWSQKLTIPSLRRAEGWRNKNCNF